MKTLIELITYATEYGIIVHFERCPVGLRVTLRKEVERVLYRQSLVIAQIELKYAKAGVIESKVEKLLTSFIESLLNV